MIFTYFFISYFFLTSFFDGLPVFSDRVLGRDIPNFMRPHCLWEAKVSAHFNLGPDSSIVIFALNRPLFSKFCILLSWTACRESFCNEIGSRSSEWRTAAGYVVLPAPRRLFLAFSNFIEAVLADVMSVFPYYRHGTTIILINELAVGALNQVRDSRGF